MRDIWVIIRPKESWYLAEVLAPGVGGTSAQGEQIAQDDYQFKVESEAEYDLRIQENPSAIWQPIAGVDYEALADESSSVSLEANGSTESLADGLEAPITIGPNQVYEQPQRVWLPIPDGVEPDSLQLYYYHPNGPGQGWYEHEQVEGWLIPDSFLYLDMEGQRYLGFLVNHAGVVQLGVLEPLD